MKKPSREELEAKIKSLSVLAEGMDYILLQQRRKAKPEAVGKYEDDTFELWGSTRACGGYVAVYGPCGLNVQYFEDWASRVTLLHNGAPDKYLIYASDIVSKFKQAQKELFLKMGGV